MQIHIKKPLYSKSNRYFLHFFIGALLFLMSSLGFAKTLVIEGTQVIDKPTQYKNMTLDLTHGSFDIKKNASLYIENTTVNVVISPSNPFFTQLTSGNLTLKNNTFNVTVLDISPNSTTQSIYQVVNVVQGTILITGNTFTIDTPYTVAFLNTNQDFTTDGFNISNNTFTNFHGGLYLINSNNAEINDNTFYRVSFSNVFNMGNMSNIERNLFTFPGNLAVGDAIDIINSDGTTISDNVIESSSGYGINIMGGQNTFIGNNHVTDGMSYGIYIQTPTMLTLIKDKYLLQILPKKKFNLIANSHITITQNYVEQNRYGLASGVVDDLIVTGNTFVQSFKDAASRLFWTNNAILLPGATNVSWLNNLYKEAFTQENEGNINPSLQFVPFPATGGVTLP